MIDPTHTGPHGDTIEIIEDTHPLTGEPRLAIQLTDIDADGNPTTALGVFDTDQALTIALALLEAYGATTNPEVVGYYTGLLNEGRAKVEERLRFAATDLKCTINHLKGTNK